MKKIGIIASVVALGAIGAYALVPALFPNTPAFPRVPVESGTIGEMIGRLIGTNDLANYFGDGTVENTNSLSWVSATGYLQSITCPATNIWKGIDANGKALCGPRVPMLTDYGRVSDQKCPATIYKTDGSTIMSSSGYILKWGDIVQTPIGCDLTIAFSDLSTLHLDEDTTVSLDMGVFPDNTTIATAILENGQIWGRILTETGVYNVGTRDVVAAVRGTSIAVSKTGTTLGLSYGTTAVSPTPRWNISGVFGVGPNGTKMTIVDSTVPTASAKIHCEMGSSIKTVVNLDMKPGTIYDMPLGTWACPTTLMTKTTDQLYTENRWIASNTLKDLWAMQKILKTISLTPAKTTKITNEFDISMPSTPWEIATICDTGKVFWGSLLETTLGIERCQSIKTVGMVDFTEYYKPTSIRLISPLRDISWILSQEISTPHGIITQSGIEIISTQSIQYATWDLLSKYNSIKNVEIIILVSNPNIVPLAFLLDGWWIQVYKNTSGQWKCYNSKNSPTTTTWGPLGCTNGIWLNTLSMSIDTTTWMIIITTPWNSEFTRFIIGNNLILDRPINNTIRSLEIKKK